MLLLGTLVSLGLLAVSLARVVPLAPVNITLTHEDVSQFDLAQIFDLTQAKNARCDVKQSAAHFYNYTTPVVTKNLSQYAFGEEPDIVNLVSNTSIYAIFDNTNILIQQVNLDHQTFGNLTVSHFNSTGAKAVCTDLELSPYFGLVYVACQNNFTASKNDPFIWILEINATTGEVIKQTSKNLTDEGVTYGHRVQLKLVGNWSNGTLVSDYVVVYDQGMTGAYMTKNQWVWALDAVQGRLTDFGILNITDISFPIIYDFFPYHGQLLVTGKPNVGRNQRIQIAYCGFKNVSGNLTVNCSDTVIDTPFHSTYGFVGRINTGQFVEVNTNPNNTADDLNVCDFGGEFGTPEFINLATCRTYLSYRTYDNVSISEVEGNQHQIVVKYTHADSSYAGYSLHQLELRFEENYYDMEDAPHLVPIGRTIVKITKTNMTLYRMVSPYVLVNAPDLADGTNIIRVDCTDDDNTTTVTNFMYAYKMVNIKDAVIANQSLVPEFSLYENDEIMIQMDPHTVLGNDLQFAVHVDQRYAAYAQAFIYDTEKINVVFNKNVSSGNYTSLRFSDQYAVAIDLKSKMLVFFNCHFTGIANVQCDERAAHDISGKNLSLRKDVHTAHRNWFFVWAEDIADKMTYFYIWDGRHAVSEIPSKGETYADATLVSSKGSTMLVVSLPHDHSILGFLFHDDTTKWTELPTLNRSITSLEFFCPTDLDFDPMDHSILEVVSLCGGQDQRILRFSYPPKFNNRSGTYDNSLISTVPLNFAYQNPQVCSMGSEFVVFSQLGNRNDITSYGNGNDRNRWYFGTKQDELNLGDMKYFNCIPRAGIFTVVSNSSQGNINLAVYWGNNQHQGNHKVYNTLRQGLNNYTNISSFELWGQVIHTLQNPDGTYDFLLTFTKGAVLELKMNYGIGNATVPFSLRFSNGYDREEFDRMVIVARPYTNITKRILKKINYAYGTYNVEKYLQLKGPVTGAQVSNRTYGAEIYGRVQEFSIFSQSAKNHIFTSMESNQMITVASYCSYNNTTDHKLYVFHDNKFVGSMNPAHGALHFHFAPFINSDNGSILIAYASLEANGSTLELVALNKSSRMGIGRATMDELTNFTKIRVVTMEIGNTFIVWGLNRNNMELHSYFVNYSNGKIETTLLEIVPNVYEFAAVDLEQLNYAAAYYIPLYNRTKIEAKAYKRNVDPRTTVAQTLSFNTVELLGELDLKDGSLLDFTYVETANLNHTHISLFLNTFGVYYLEVVFDLTLKDLPKSYVYFKVPNSYGRVIKANERHFVDVTMEGNGASTRFSYHVYERIGAGGSPHLYWRVPGEGTREPRPFSISTDYTERRTHMMLATMSVTTPLVFNTIGPMEISVQRYSNLSSIVIEVDGIFPQPRVYTNFSEIYVQVSASDSGSSWVSPLVIATLVTVFVALVAKSLLKSSHASSGHTSI